MFNRLSKHVKSVSKKKFVLFLMSKHNYLKYLYLFLNVYFFINKINKHLNGTGKLYFVYIK